MVGEVNDQRYGCVHMVVRTSKNLVKFETVESSFDGECEVMKRVDDLQG